MPKKLKSESCSGGWCRNHVFELTPFKKGLHLKKSQKMRLCPHFNNNLNKFSKSIPVLNQDNKFYTPTFILEDEQKIYEENNQRFLIRHLEKVQQNESGKSQMVIFFESPREFYSFSHYQTQLVAKQSANKTYCGVCHQLFQDYLEHITAEKHKKNVHKSKITTYIKEIEGKYKKINKRGQEDKIKIKTQPSEDSYSAMMMNECGPERTQIFTKNQLPSQFN